LYYRGLTKWTGCLTPIEKGQLRKPHRTKKIVGVPKKGVGKNIKEKFK